MKTVALLITTLILSSAQARSLMPHKPIRSADMKILKANGIFAQTKTVKLAEWGVNRQTLKVGNLFVIQHDDKLIQLNVVSVSDAGCGSIRVVANDRNQPGIPERAEVSLSLFDHSTRTCEDYRPYVWEATLTHAPFLHHEVLSELAIAGNPKVDGMIRPLNVSMKRFETVKAQMNVNEATGIFADVENVVIKETIDYAIDNGTRSYEIILGDQVYALEKTLEQTDGCGSVHVQLVNETFNALKMELNLTDHRTRKCKDLQPYRWVAGLTGTVEKEVVGLMKLVGNPQK